MNFRGMAKKRLIVSMPVMIAGGIAVFAAGANICLFALIWTGRLTCFVPADHALHAMGPLPHPWVAFPLSSCIRDAISGADIACAAIRLVIDVGAFDGKEAIEYASAGHQVWPHPLNFGISGADLGYAAPRSCPSSPRLQKVASLASFHRGCLGLTWAALPGVKIRQALRDAGRLRGSRRNAISGADITSRRRRLQSHLLSLGSVRQSR
eukprot:2212587-Rhodomonas_salina.2